MVMSPEESALLVKLQVIKAERDRYLEALEEISATGADFQTSLIARNALYPKEKS